MASPTVHHGGEQLRVGEVLQGRTDGGDDDRQVEDRTGAGAKRLGIEGVDRLSGHDDRGCARGVGRSNDRADVARIAKVMQDQDEARFWNRGDVALFESHGGQDRLGRLGVGDLFDDALGEGEHSHAFRESVVGEGRDRGPFERRGVDVDRLELSATLECRVDEVGSFEDADALAPAQRTFLDESP